MPLRLTNQKIQNAKPSDEPLKRFNGPHGRVVRNPDTICGPILIALTRVGTRCSMQRRQHDLDAKPATLAIPHGYRSAVQPDAALGDREADATAAGLRAP